MIDLYTKQWLVLSVCHSLLINFGAYNFVIKNSTILAKNEEIILFNSRTKFQFFVPKCNDPYNLPNVKHTRELFQTSLLSFQYWLCEKLLLERHPVPDLLLRMSAAAGRGWVANVFKDVKRSVLWSPSKFWKWGEKLCVWEDIHNCVCKNKVQVKNEFLISINI